MILREGGLALDKQRLRTKKLVQYIETKIYNFPYYYSNIFPDFRSNSLLTYEVWNSITVIIKILLLNVELLREDLFSVIELFLLSLINIKKLKYKLLIKS